MPRRKLKLPGSWREHAKCKGMDPAFFYPERSHEGAKRAKDFCSTCPVKDDCREEAIAFGEKFGIWGGEDTQERQRIAKKRRLD